MTTIPISETKSLKSVGLNETWLQDQIWENPSCLGLGELESVIKEHVVSSGGRLDILLKNPVDDSMYEVETQLGETDPSHIVRTIEYWDIVKRKWPQRQHFAVIVAERITKRFFNVIQILSGAVPLIAIQVNIIESPHGRCLHFTKILDVYEEPDDDTGETGTYDEPYWIKHSKSTLDTAKYLQDLTKDIYNGTELRFNKNYVTIATSGYNQMIIRKRSGENVLLQMRYGDKSKEMAEVLEADGIQFNDHNQNQFKFLMPVSIVQEKSEMFLKLARLNKEWWTS